SEIAGRVDTRFLTGTNINGGFRMLYHGRPDHPSINGELQPLPDRSISPAFLIRHEEPAGQRTRLPRHCLSLNCWRVGSTDALDAESIELDSGVLERRPLPVGPFIGMFETLDSEPQRIHGDIAVGELHQQILGLTLVTNIH